MAPASLQALQTLVALRQQCPPVSRLNAMVDRAILKLTKSLTDILEVLPDCRRSCLRGAWVHTVKNVGTGVGVSESDSVRIQL